MLNWQNNDIHHCIRLLYINFSSSTYVTVFQTFKTLPGIVIRQTLPAHFSFPRFLIARGGSGHETSRDSVAYINSVLDRVSGVSSLMNRSTSSRNTDVIISSCLLAGTVEDV